MSCNCYSIYNGIIIPKTKKRHSFHKKEEILPVSKQNKGKKGKKEKKGKKDRMSMVKDSLKELGLDLQIE